MPKLLTQKNNRPSFSLLEVILLIALVSVAFLGVSSLLRQTLQLEGLIKNDFIGNALADEGIALVEAMRNDNIVANSLLPFKDIANAPGPQVYFKVDKSLIKASPRINMGLLGADFVTENSRLNFHAVNYYNHAAVDPVTNTATNFYRMIIATPYTSPVNPAKQMIRVTSVVTLKYRGKTYTYVRCTVLNDGTY